MKDDFIKELITRIMNMAGTSFTEEMAIQVEEQIRHDYGGSEVWISPPEKIPKIKKDQAVKDYLAGKPVEEVTTRNGISRATLYRHLKR